MVHCCCRRVQCKQPTRRRTPRLRACIGGSEGTWHEFPPIRREAACPENSRCPFQIWPHQRIPKGFLCMVQADKQLMFSRQAINSLIALHEAMPEELKDKVMHRYAAYLLFNIYCNELQKSKRLTCRLWGNGTAFVPVGVWSEGRPSARHARLCLPRHGYLSSFTFPVLVGLRDLSVRVVLENDWLWGSLWPYRSYIFAGNFLHHGSCVDCRRYSPTNSMAFGRRSEGWCHS